MTVYCIRSSFIFLCRAPAEVPGFSVHRRLTQGDLWAYQAPFSLGQASMLFGW